MDIDKLTIVVRPRSVSEVIDLGLSLVRRYWWQLGLLGFIGIGAVLLGSIVLTLFIDEMAYRIFVLILFCLTLSPMAIAPLTAFLGQSMFSNQPRVRSALGMFFGSFGALLAFSLIRLVPTAFLAWYAQENPAAGAF